MRSLKQINLKELTIEKTDVIIFVITFIILATFPIFIRSLYWLQAIIYAMFLATAATSNDLLLGYSGVFSIAPLAFFLIGAYTAALLSGGYHTYIPGGGEFIGLNWNPWLTIPLAGAFCALIGVALAFPSLRIRGIYLAFLLMAFSELVNRIIRQEDWLTGGTIGFRLSYKLPFIPFDRIVHYYLVLLFVIASIIVLNKMAGSRIGLILRAMRDNEVATKHLGIGILRYRLIAFMLSAFLIGVSGAFYAYVTGYITYEIGLTMKSFFVVVMSMFGGVGTLVGPFIGSLLFVLLGEYLRWLEELRMVIFGVVLLLTILYVPKGVVGTILERINRWKIKTELVRKK